jgi:hypothetical protein
MFRPTWPSLGNTYYVQNTWQEVNSTENYGKEQDLILKNKKL